MSLSRAAVRGFARTYWDVPCPDGKVAGINYAHYLRVARQALTKRAVADGDIWQPVFLREATYDAGEGLYLVRPSAVGAAKARHQRVDVADTDLQLIHPDKGLLDCAHYSSSALASAGVNALTDSAPTLHEKLFARSDTQTFATRAAYPIAKAIFDSGMLLDGDMIFYSLSGAIHHCALILGGKYISCHTRSRHPLNIDDRDWDLGHDTWTYTLLHFKTDDDPAPSTKTQAALPGWWAMQFGAQTVYYYFNANGSVHGAGHRPASAKTSASSANVHGYWYEKSGKIIVFWSKTGTSHEFTLSASGDTLTRAASDDHGAATGTKII